LIVCKEKQPLDEMAVRVISSHSDGLPFRITIQSPDHIDKPHAHLKDLATGNKELGQFEIPRAMHGCSEDIKDYLQGIPDEWRELIFRWGKAPWKKNPYITNWMALYNNWRGNEEF
jgi:hypothetical protein